MSQDLASALVDVRRAYRLLWAYQKRVAHCTSFIRDRLGFSPDHVDYLFGRPGDTIEYGWAWSALPFVDIGFVSVKPKPEDDEGGFRGRRGRVAADLLLYVQVVSDTEVDSAWCKDLSQEPRADEFGPPDAGGSEIRLFMARVHPHCTVPISAPRKIVKMLNEHGRWPGNGETIRDDAIGIDLYASTIDLADVGDLDALADHIDTFAADAGNSLGVVL